MPSYLLLSLLGLVLLLPLAAFGAAGRGGRPDRAVGRADLRRREQATLRAAIRTTLAETLRTHAPRRTAAAAGAEPPEVSEAVMRVPVYRYDAAGRCCVDAWTIHLN